MENKERNNHIEPFIVRHLHALGRQHHVPVSVTFELTSRCNFSCKMCYVHAFDCNKNKEKELSAPQWLEIAEQAKSKGAVFLLLTGGEPLLREDFCEIYEALAQMGFIISINSNLSLLNEKHLALFRKYRPNRINTSLYGVTDETYKALCGVPAFRKVAAAIEALKEIGVPVKVNCSVTPYNRGELEQIFAYGTAHDLPVQATSYMFPAMRCGNQEKQTRFSPEEAGTVSVVIDRLRFSEEQFAKRAERMQKKMAVDRNAECPEEPVEGSEIRCRAGVSTAWVDWQGNLSFCGMIPAKPTNNILQTGLDTCWEQVQKEASAVHLPTKCAVCIYRNLCSICAAAAYTETGAYNKVPAYICKMTETTVQAYENIALPLSAQSEKSEQERGTAQ